MIKVGRPGPQQATRSADMRSKNRRTLLKDASIMSP